MLPRNLQLTTYAEHNHADYLTALQPLFTHVRTITN
jgi:hypothetical protein